MLSGPLRHTFENITCQETHSSHGTVFSGVVQMGPFPGCSESGQSVPLSNPDLILLAAGSSLRPCCRSRQSHRKQEELPELRVCEAELRPKWLQACSYISPILQIRKLRLTGVMHTMQALCLELGKQDLNPHLYGSRQKGLIPVPYPLGVSWPREKIIWIMFSRLRLWRSI